MDPKLTLTIFILTRSVFVSGLRECGKYGTYDKLDAMHRFLVCVISDFCDSDAEASEPEMLVKTAKKLITKSGKDLREYRECGWSQIRQNFPQKYQIALNESRLFANPITPYCASREEICKIHKKFLYPVMCLLESKCGRMLSKLIYAFFYGIGQLNAETEEYLNCEDNTFDVNRNTIFETDFCQKVPHIESILTPRKRSKSFFYSNWL